MDSRRLPPQPPRYRFAGLVSVTLLHGALFWAWHAALDRHRDDEGEPSFVQWVMVPQHPPESLPPAGPVEPARDAVSIRAARSATKAARPAGDRPGGDAITAPPTVTADAAEPEALPAGAGTGELSDATRRLVEQARRDAGAIERELRKQRNPTIVAPPDSPQIRMAQKFREAAARVPNRLWEAPKIVELVNDSGDGKRRTRVLTAAGLYYCIAERSPATSIDTIERHGKQQITNCGHDHLQQANPQEWRTARD